MKKRIIQKVKPELMPRISARPLPFLQVKKKKKSYIFIIVTI